MATERGSSCAAALPHGGSIAPAPSHLRLPPHLHSTRICMAGETPKSAALGSGFGHRIMEARHLRGIKRRVERTDGAEALVDANHGLKEAGHHDGH